MKYKLLFFFSVTLFLSSCFAIIFDEVECKEYELANELFWFQGDVLKEYVFVNKSLNTERKFYFMNRSLEHMKSYKYLRNNEDGNCGCYDKSTQLLVGDNDTIQISNTSSYENIKDTYLDNSESFTLKFGDTKDVMRTETSEIHLSTIIVNDNEVKTKTFISEFGGVKTTLLLGEGIGPIRIEFYNGEIWERKEIKVAKIVPVYKYSFSNIYCYDLRKNTNQ